LHRAAGAKRPPQNYPEQSSRLAAARRSTAPRLDYERAVTIHQLAIRTHRPLYLFFIYPSHQDFFLYTKFFRTHPSSIYYGTHLSLCLNIFM
jgi:hypothetical protein